MREPKKVPIELMVRGKATTVMLSETMRIDDFAAIATALGMTVRLEILPVEFLAQLPTGPKRKPHKQRGPHA